MEGASGCLFAANQDLQVLKIERHVFAGHELHVGDGGRLAHVHVVGEQVRASDAYLRVSGRWAVSIGAALDVVCTPQHPGGDRCGHVRVLDNDIVRSPAPRHTRVAAVGPQAPHGLYACKSIVRIGVPCTSAACARGIRHKQLGHGGVSGSRIEDLDASDFSGVN